MKKYIILFIVLFGTVSGYSQAIIKTVGVVITNGTPTHTPSAQGAVNAYDITNGISYKWFGNAWVVDGTSNTDSTTVLFQDSILIYYDLGVEYGRDTIRFPIVNLSGYVQYSDSLTVFVTPDQLSDSLAALPDSIVTGYGVAGYLPQYLSATTQDTTGLYWDATKGMLGIGTVLPLTKIDILSSGSEDGFRAQSNNASAIAVQGYSTSGRAGLFRAGGTLPVLTVREITGLSGNLVQWQNNGGTGLGGVSSTGRLGLGTITPTAKNHTVGEGTTSSTTALLVENSAGTDGFRVLDNGSTITEGIGYTLGYNHVAQRYGFGNGVYPGANYGYMRGSSNGIFSLVDAAESDFNRLCFGGTSSSYPSLKRVTTNFEVKLANDTYGAGLSVGGALEASAIFEAESSTKGLLVPRMTTAQRDAISSPATGLMLFCTDCTATDGSTGVSQTYSSGTWRNHY